MKSYLKYSKNNKVFERQLRLVIALFFVVILWWLLPEYYIVHSVTNSDGFTRGIAIKLGSSPLFSERKFRRGDVVSFKEGFLRRIFPGGLLVKTIACVSGDVICRRANVIYCNNIPLAYVRHYTSMFVPLFSPFKENECVVIPEDMYFVVGEGNLPRSYDSRYLGFIGANRFLYKVYPLDKKEKINFSVYEPLPIPVNTRLFLDYLLLMR
jgi:signal peptidase I